MKVNNDLVGDLDLSGSMTQQQTQTLDVDDKEKTHIGNLGKMIEDMELKIRNAIEGVYIQKTREVINGMRQANAGKEKQFESIVASLKGAVQQHGNTRKKDTE